MDRDNKNEALTSFDNATEAVRETTEMVETASKSIAAAIDADRQRGGALAHVADAVRQAPLRAMAMAFLAGLIVARRR